MCGRFVSSTSADQVAAHFAAVLEPELAEDPPRPRFNVAPSSGVLVVGERVDGDTGERERLLRAHRWGLVPKWAKSPAVGNRMINARAETLATKNAYRRPFARRRCIVPADGFYEWRVVEGDRRKQPVFIRSRDGSPLAMAGLWEIWTDAEDHHLRSCTIVTTTANATVAPIHDRMPVLLPEGAWSRWLDPRETDIDAVSDLLVPAPDDALEWWPVGYDVGNVRNDRPDLTAPI
ncbi:MAG TPA: SOS response-associated peptidase [Acidimicrobiales bacterium]